MKRGQETAIAIGVAIGAGLLLATRGPRAPESVPKGMGFMEGHSGKDYMRSLGERPSAARETGILEAVRQGFIVPITWVALTFQRAGHEVTIQAASDSLRVGSTLGDDVDYSQTVQLYGARCTIDGAERSVIEVLRDPASAFLLSDEVREGTACRVTRHPAVAPPGA